MNAIGNRAKETNPDLVVRYITSKDFVDEIINSIKTNTTDDIYSYYRNIDILLIDDIQFLFGKEKVVKCSFISLMKLLIVIIKSLLRAIKCLMNYKVLKNV